MNQTLMVLYKYTIWNCIGRKNGIFRVIKIGKFFSVFNNNYLKVDLNYYPWKEDSRKYGTHSPPTRDPSPLTGRTFFRAIFIFQTVGGFASFPRLLHRYLQRKILCFKFISIPVNYYENYVIKERYYKTVWKHKKYIQAEFVDGVGVKMVLGKLERFGRDIVL